MENECEALPGVAYPGVRDNRSTLNTKTGYDDDDKVLCKRGLCCHAMSVRHVRGLCRNELNISSKFFHHQVATPF